MQSVSRWAMPSVSQLVFVLGDVIDVTLGDAVGVAVDVDVGVAVGVALGIAVGVAVGVAVGAGVGENVGRRSGFFRAALLNRSWAVDAGVKTAASLETDVAALAREEIA